MRNVQSVWEIAKFKIGLGAVVQSVQGASKCKILESKVDDITGGELVYQTYSHGEDNSSED